MGRLCGRGDDVRPKTALATFQRIILEDFGEYIPAFMQVFLNDFAVYGVVKIFGNGVKNT